MECSYRKINFPAQVIYIISIILYSIYFIFSLFHSIEQVRETTEFPEYEKFFSLLKRSNCDLDEYNICKAEYNRRRALPETHPDKMWNMSCWLKFYNLMDVAPLVMAIETAFENYAKNFNCDPAIKASLPGLAFDAMCQMSDKTMPLIYTHDNEKYHKVFKNNIVGGICNVYHKLIYIGDDEKYPPASRNAPNGQPFTYCLFLDFNSMYLGAQMQNMPLTAGKITKLYLKLYKSIIYKLYKQ